MNTSRSTWRYDLFKFFVALILLLVLLASFFQNKSSTPGPEVNGGGASTLTTTTNSQGENQVPEELENPSEASLPPFPDSPLLLTVDDTRHYLLGPDGQPIYELDDESFQWLPVIPEEILEELPEEVTLEEPCPVSLPPRLQVGEKARARVNLNMRSSPGIKDNWLLTNVTGTELTVLSGPVCMLQEGEAYWWWEVENPSGVRGWSAEAHQGGIFYFLEPVSH